VLLTSISGRLDVEIEIGVPNVSSRTSILTKLLRRSGADGMTEEDVVKVAQAAHGFVGADLDALVRAATTDDGVVDKESFKRAFKIVKPSAMRQVQVGASGKPL
jgi:SpoVK/Ycf46/Vps4 family AAA+-type ATPase